LGHVTSRCKITASRKITELLPGLEDELNTDFVSQLCSGTSDDRRFELAPPFAETLAGPAQVVTLGRRRDRWATLVARLADHGFEVGADMVPFDAVDGQALALDDPRLAVFHPAALPALLADQPGVVGCALSHIALWRAHVANAAARCAAKAGHTGGGGAPFGSLNDAADAVAATADAAAAAEALVEVTVDAAGNAAGGCAADGELLLVLEDDAQLAVGRDELGFFLGFLRDFDGVLFLGYHARAALSAYDEWAVAAVGSLGSLGSLGSIGREAAGAPAAPRALYRAVPLAPQRYLGGTFAYVVSAAHAARLLRAVDSEGLRDGAIAIDHFIRANSAGRLLMAVEPRIAHSDFAYTRGAHDSDIARPSPRRT
jgi:hypothetical protein